MVTHGLKLCTNESTLIRLHCLPCPCCTTHQLLQAGTHSSLRHISMSCLSPHVWHVPISTPHLVIAGVPKRFDLILLEGIGVARFLDKQPALWGVPGLWRLALAAGGIWLYVTCNTFVPTVPFARPTVHKPISCPHFCSTECLRVVCRTRTNSCRSSLPTLLKVGWVSLLVMLLPSRTLATSSSCSGLAARLGR